MLILQNMHNPEGFCLIGSLDEINIQEGGVGE